MVGDRRNLLDQAGPHGRTDLDGDAPEVAIEERWIPVHPPIVGEIAQAIEGQTSQEIVMMTRWRFAGRSLPARRGRCGRGLTEHMVYTIVSSLPNTHGGHR